MMTSREPPADYGRSSALRPLGKSRVYERIVRRLLDYVIEAGLGAGDRLPTERELAELMSASRASVRQAIVVLEVRGIVSVRHGGGIYLTRGEESLAQMLERRSRLPDILEAREVLEVKLAQLAARRRNETDLSIMADALDTMAEDIETGGIGMDGDEKFHRAVTNAAHNPILAELMNYLSEPIRETRFESLSEPHRPPNSLVAHQQIADAIESGDTRRAGRAMRDHLRMVANVRLMRLSDS